MAEEEIVVTEEESTSENVTVEPHGSASAPRPGDRKYGNHKGRPSERRNGRGGFRKNLDDYLERVVAINRISKTTQGGKNMRFSALAVVGDGKGKYGFALAKSTEVPDAIKKALAKARKNMVSIEIVNGTIAHDVEGKFGATKVVLKPAPAGTGVVAGGAVRAIVELCGIRNLVAKVYGSRSPINVLRATHAGLAELKRYDKVMVLRGKKTEEQIRAARAAKAPKAAPAVEEKGDNE
jgi:small subunit ribosomal protein S5